MKATNKQTAVEWLEKELNWIEEINWIEENKYTSYIELKIKQAKAMEKEQMKAFYTMHIVDTRTMELFDFYEYYKQTYESNT